jgi:hypothetical protein
MTAWHDLVMTAVLGTERQAPALPGPETPLGELLTSLSAAVEHRLLAAAGTLALYERAGRLPAQDPQALPSPAADEVLPRCPAPAGHHLAVMLKSQYAEVLPEWLAAVAGARCRVPEEHLPALLDWGRAHAEWLPAIQAVAGNRGHWLAYQNAEWAYVAGGRDESLWQIGNSASRRLLLARLRREDPPRARDLLAATWAEESTDDRADFLALFATGLSGADEPFLESALDDRHKEVRRAAAGLLGRLPESRLVARMLERVRPLLSYTPEQKGLLRLGPKSKTRLDVTLPAACDKEMIRDGVEPKALAGLGEKAGWLAQMLGVIPPATWATLWNARPADVIAAVRDNDWRGALQQGLIRATLRHQDATWAEALLAVWRTRGGDLDPQGLLGVLPPDRREAFILRHLAAARGKLHDDSALLNLLWECALPWSLELSRAVLAELRLYAADSQTSHDWEFRQALKRFGSLMAPTLDAEARHGWPDSVPIYWREAIDELSALLHFRAEMHAALVK